MTLKDLLKRVSEDDYDKVIVVSDGKGWNNIENNIVIDGSTITLFEDRNPLKSKFLKEVSINMNNKKNSLTVEVKATEIDEVKDIIASFIFMLEDNRIDYMIRKQYLESCKYLKDNFFVNLER